MRPKDLRELAASCVGGREQMRDAVEGSLDPRATRRGDPAGERASRSHADLLPEDRTHGKLEPVGRTGDADPGRRPHERSERGVRRQRGVDHRRIGVEVEQTSRQRDEGGRLHLIRGAAEDHLVPVEAGGEGDHRVRSVGGPHRATEGRPVERLDTRDRAIAQEPQERIDRDRRSVPEPPHDGAVGHGPTPSGISAPTRAIVRRLTRSISGDRSTRSCRRRSARRGSGRRRRGGRRRRSAAWVAVLGISSTWWVTSMVVGDASAVEDNASSSSSRPGRSRPAAGSSSRRSCGRPNSARASNTRWRSPWLHVASGRPASSAHPTRASRWSARRRSSASNVCIHGTSVERLPVSTTSRTAKCPGIASAT